MLCRSFAQNLNKLKIKYQSCSKASKIDGYCMRMSCLTNKFKIMAICLQYRHCK